MEDEQNIIGIDTIAESKKAKTSKLAITSMVFGMLGPFCFVIMWIVSVLSFHDLIASSRYTIAAFSYGVAWVLGLVFGMKSLEQIGNSEEQLVGRKYAIIGISISVLWMVLMVARFLLPGLYYVNS